MTSTQETQTTKIAEETKSEEKGATIEHLREKRKDLAYLENFAEEPLQAVYHAILIAVEKIGDFLRFHTSSKTKQANMFGEM